MSLLSLMTLIGHNLSNILNMKGDDMIYDPLIYIISICESDVVFAIMSSRHGSSCYDITCDIKKTFTIFVKLFYYINLLIKNCKS